MNGASIAKSARSARPSGAWDGMPDAGEIAALRHHVEELLAERKAGGGDPSRGFQGVAPAFPGPGQEGKHRSSQLPPQRRRRRLVGPDGARDAGQGNRPWKRPARSSRHCRESWKRSRPGRRVPPSATSSGRSGRARHLRVAEHAFEGAFRFEEGGLRPETGGRRIGQGRHDVRLRVGVALPGRPGTRARSCRVRGSPARNIGIRPARTDADPHREARGRLPVTPSRYLVELLVWCPANSHHKTRRIFRSVRPERSEVCRAKSKGGCVAFPHVVLATGVTAGRPYKSSRLADNEQSSAYFSCELTGHRTGGLLEDSIGALRTSPTLRTRLS